MKSWLECCAGQERVPEAPADSKNLDRSVGNPRKSPYPQLQKLAVWLKKKPGKIAQCWLRGGNSPSQCTFFFPCSIRNAGVVVVLRLLMTYEDLVQKPAEQIHRTWKNQLWDGFWRWSRCAYGPYGCVWKQCTPKANGFHDHYPYEKWLFHWEY